MTKHDIPNLLTFFRVAAMLIVLVAAGFFPAERYVIFWMFVLASVTDFFDGYFARKWNAVTPLGTMLDPIADKLLVAVVLIYLVKFTIVPVGAVAIILCREIYIAGLREYLALKQIALPVSRGGKWKTALQLIALTMLLASVCYPMPYALVNGVLVNPANAGMLLLWVSALLAVISAVSYSRAAARALR